MLMDEGMVYFRLEFVQIFASVGEDKYDQHCNILLHFADCLTVYPNSVQAIRL